MSATLFFSAAEMNTIGRFLKTEDFDMLDKLLYYFQFPFVTYALIAGALTALCSSVFGVTLVLRRFSFIGDGLSHVAFFGLAIAGVLSVSNSMLVVMPVTIICAVAVLCTGKRSKIRGDASIAMLSVGALALGYLVMNIFSVSSNLSGDVCSTLFGSASILTLTSAEVWLCVILSAAVILLFVLFYNKIFSVTFDSDFAESAGVRTRVFNLFLAVIIAVIIVLAMNLVGSLLISALIIFPALSAMRLFKSYRAVIIFSAVFSVLCAVTGILTAVLTGTPVGSTVVAVDIAGFLLCCCCGFILKRV